MRVRIQLEGDTPRTREVELADHLTEEEEITEALLALTPEEYPLWSAMYLFRKGSTAPRVILNKNAASRRTAPLSTAAEDLELGDQGQSGG